MDLNAVQRGDAEMEQKMNRLVRACIECRGDNPILSIHDQGAGGNGKRLFDNKKKLWEALFIKYLLKIKN